LKLGNSFDENKKPKKRQTNGWRVGRDG